MCAPTKFISLISFSILTWFAFFGLAQNARANDSHFLNGYWHLLNTHYGMCAESMMKASSDEDNPIYDRSKLYLAECQVKLGYDYAAATNLIDIDVNGLGPKERFKYNMLRGILHKEIKVLLSTNIYLYPYYGIKAYTPATDKTSGQFFGLVGEILNKDYRLYFGIERLDIKLTNFVDPYRHNQYHIGLDLYRSLSWTLGIKYFQIAPDSIANRNVSTPGAKFIFYPNEHFNVEFDTSYSLYSNSEFGRLTVFQGIVRGSFRMFETQKNQGWFRLGVVSILPNGASSVDLTTGYSLQKYYYRFPVELDLTFTGFQFTVGGWIGKEIYGFRPKGSIFYISAEEHNLGMNATLRISTRSGQSNWGVQFIYFYESVTPVGTDYIDHTFATTLYFEL